MTEYIIKLIKKRGKKDVRSSVGIISGAVGIVSNLALFAAKLILGTISGSVSITADAMNNLSDASASILTLLGFRLASKPADDEHPFGHARYEYLSGLAVSVIIMIIGFELGKSGLEKILSPEPVDLSALGIVILLLSIAVKLGLFLFNRSLGKKIESGALLATAADSRNDCIATGAVLIASLAEKLTNIPLDGWFGMAVAVFILISGWKMARETISPLLGEAADDELRREIVDYIVAQPMVLGYHDLMVHDYGPGRRYASVHVEMDRNADPMESHERIDDMERECLRTHGIHLVIHYDPIVVDDPELNRLRDRCEEIIKNYDSRLSLHDFRMVQGRKHMNIVFDIPLPSDMRGKEKEIRSLVEDTLNSEGDKIYHALITFDSEMFNR